MTDERIKRLEAKRLRSTATSWAVAVIFMGGLLLSELTITKRSEAQTFVAPTGGGLNNVTYVQRGTDISNLLFNARSGMTFEFDTMTNVIDGKVPTTTFDVKFSPIKLTNLANVTLLGKGNTVLSNRLDGLLFGIIDCTNIVVDGFIFSGQGRTNATTYDSSGVVAHGLVQLTGTNYNVTFRRCVFQDCNFFGLVSSQYSGYSPRTYNLHMIDCWFARCGHTNMTAGVVDGGAAAIHPDAVFENCVFDDCSRGVESYSPSEGGGLLVVRNSVFRGIWMRGVFLNSDINFGARGLVDGCAFIPDNAKRRGGSHVMVNKASDSTIQNCLFTNLTIGADYGVEVDAEQYGLNRNIRVINNTFALCALGLAFQNTYGGLVSGNHFYGCNYAIQFAADGALVTENEFWDCGQLGDAFSQPIFCNAYAGTNCAFTHNRFIRKTGTAPPSWIWLDANQRNYVIKDNLYEDVSSGVAYIQDGGVGTRFSIGTGYTTNAVVLGTGNGNTNYTLMPWFDDVYLGSSNVNISAIMATSWGWSRKFTVNVTNLSASTWGITFSAATNRWRFRNSHTGGTNAPTVLTNTTLTKLEIEADGTNTNVRWHTQAHP